MRGAVCRVDVVAVRGDGGLESVLVGFSGGGVRSRGWSGFVLGAERGGSGEGVKRAKEGTLASRSSLEMTALRRDAAREFS